MGRPHIEFIESHEVPLEPYGEGPFAGTRRRLLSEDDETGASTAIVSFPRGWSGDLAGSRRPLEIFGLRGDLELDGERIGPGGYAYVPPSAAGRAIAATTGADALVMIEPEQAAFSGEPASIIDTTTNAAAVSRPLRSAKEPSPKRKRRSHGCANARPRPKRPKRHLTSSTSPRAQPPLPKSWQRRISDRAPNPTLPTSWIG